MLNVCGEKTHSNTCTYPALSWWVVRNWGCVRQLRGVGLEADAAPVTLCVAGGSITGPARPRSCISRWSLVVGLHPLALPAVIHETASPGRFR